MPGPAAQRAMSIVTAGMGVAPIAAPMIGGALLLWFEWPAIFVTLAASGAAMFLAVFLLLQETRERHHRTELRPVRVMLTYAEMMRNRTFLSFSMPSLLAGAVTPILTAVAVAEAPDRPGAVIGRMFALGAAGAILGTALAGFVLLQWIGSIGSLAAVAVVEAVLAAFYLRGWSGRRAGAVALMAILAGQGLAFAAAP